MKLRFWKAPLIGTMRVTAETFDELAGSFTALGMIDSVVYEGAIILDGVQILRGDPRSDVASAAQEKAQALNNDPIARHRARVLSAGNKRG